MKKVLLVIIAVILVLTFTGCNKENSNISGTTIEANEQKNTDNNKEDNEIVSELFFKNEMIRDESDDLLLSYEIRIPYINIQSSDVNTLNDYFKSFKKFVEKVTNSPETAYEQENMDNEFVHAGLDFYIFDYEYSIMENRVLSLMTNGYYIDGSGGPEYGNYKVYNIDIDSGKMLTTSEVLGAEKAKKVQENIESFYTIGFENLNRQYIENNEFESYYESAKKTIKELIPDDINDIPCFDGKLVIKTFGPPVGITGDEPNWTVLVDVDEILGNI